MNQDNNVYYQPEGTYRFANNLQLVNHDGNNITLKDTLGNREIVLLDVPFASVIASYATEPMPLNFVSFPDGRLIVFHTNSESTTGGGGEIGQMFLTNIGQSVEADNQTIMSQVFSGYVPLYYHDLLYFSKLYKIEGFGFSENDQTNRVYWTDNFNEPRVFNITNPIFTTYIGNTNLVIGTTYMVISGAINHAGIDYGKGLTATNIFTALNANYTAIAGNVLVIEYFPYQLLNWTPERTMGNMHFVEYGAGVKNCGSSVYFYRLGRRSEGYFTTWSFGSAPIHVGVQNDSSVLTANTYTNFVGDGSATTLVVSDKSIKVFIDNIDTNFDVIQLACAEYDQLYTTPYFIAIVQEEPITGTSITMEDFGNKNLGTLTIDDVTLFPASILRAKTITTDKNYNIVGNITEREQVLADVSNLSITSFEYPMPVHGDDQLCGNDFLYYNVLPTADLTANPAATTIIPWSRYLVTTLGTGTVFYNGNFYNAGDVITGVVGQTTITFTGTAQVRPCVNTNRYTTTLGINKPNAIEIRTGFWDYKDPTVASTVKGYWSHEKYRWALLCYDKKGNPFYTQYLADYDMPLVSAKGGLMRADSYLGTNMWSLNPSIMRFSGIRFTADVVNQISGFSIVRAPRDARIITQGLVMQNAYIVTAGIANVYPNDYILNNYVTGIADEIYTYICPDELVGLPEKKTIGVDGDKMEEAAWVEGLTWNGVYFRSGNANYDVYTKQFTAKTDASSIGALRSITIKSDGWLNLNEDTTVTNVFVTPNTDYLNNFVVGGAPPNVDSSCYGGGITSVNGRIATGGKKIIFYANTFKHFGQYPSGYNYTAQGQTNPNKILMNYVKELTNPYGGTGDTAKANTLYISTGHFQPINATVLADVETAPNSGIYEFNNVEVGGGDCFTCLVDQGYALQTNPITSQSIGFYFPCECNSNYGLRRGRKISNVGMGSGASYPNGVSWNPARLEDYSYNAGYSSEGAQFLYPSIPVNYLNSTRFPTRTRFAGKKIIGEIIDSFRVFLINDYTDVDVQLGEINNLKAKGDYVYYWQNHGVGSMPILERQMISQTQGSATSLGTGGVLTRFDTISTKYGNQHQWGLTDTEFGWIWFDMRNKDVCIMSFGGAVQEITVPTGMKSFFGEVFLERLTEIYNDIYLNSQTYDASSDRPLMGTGIIGVYDPKNKMSYLTFKFRSYFKRDEVFEYDDYQILNKDFTIGFSHTLNKWVSFYDKTPAIWHNHGQVVLSANNPKNLEVYYAGDMVFPTPITVGGVVKAENKEYICYLAGNITSYSVPPDPTMFIEINKTNQVWVENSEKAPSVIINGYEYNKFYNRVVNNQIELIVNPKAGQISVTNYEMGATGDNITDITISADSGQTASDTNIKSYNRDYGFADGSWWGNLPLFKGSRITDKYLKIRLTKNNRTSILVYPYLIEAGLRTTFQYLRSFFVAKN